MFKSIVVGTDGSPGATEAVAGAAELARATGATLHIAMAYRSMTDTAGLLSAEPASGAAIIEALPQIENAMERAAANTVKSAARVAGDVDIQLHTHPGDAADVLLGVAEKVDADLIVVGNKGMKGARRLLGSVPNNVAHRAPCAVLILPTT